jgi:hypothetical protein
MAQGLTNAEIAARLYVSRHTLQHHVTAVYASLGVTSRAQAVVYAIGHGLTEQAGSRTGRAAKRQLSRRQPRQE